jgi:hypothetical protein
MNTAHPEFAEVCGVSPLQCEIARAVGVMQDFLGKRFPNSPEVLVQTGFTFRLYRQDHSETIALIWPVDWPEQSFLAVHLRLDGDNWRAYKGEAHINHKPCEHGLLEEFDIISTSTQFYVTPSPFVH